MAAEENKFFDKKFLYEKVNEREDQKAFVIKLLFETGIKVSELKRVVAITNETITIVQEDGKTREVFHNISTTSGIKKFDLAVEVVKEWIKDVLGESYTPDSLRISHGRHLILNGANPRMVQLQMGFKSIKQTLNFLQITDSKN